MPQTMPTLLDIAKRANVDQVVGLIEEASKSTPEISNGFARTIPGLNYPTLVRTALPTVGFRNANEGSAISLGRFENRLVECFLMNPQWECDKAVADAAVDGAEVYIADEGVALTMAAMITLGSQFYYGKTLDVNKGYPGLISSVDSSLVLDATGTTADTCSSVWGVKWGRQDVSWVWGLNGNLDLSDVTECRITDGSGNPFTAYRQELTGRPGVQVASKFSVGRIKKLTADSGKGLTDALITTFLAMFPINRKPDVLYCTQRSLMQLQKSRTATNATGVPAPLPTESNGVPIIPTESLTDTEALTL